MSGKVRIVKGGGQRGEGGKGARREQRASPARRAAFEILRRVEEEGSFAAPLLAGLDERLRADDRALCYELVLGTLRRQLWLDKLLEHYAGRSAESLDAPVRRALRLGLYQLRFLSRVPASAAVNESVNLAHEARLRSAVPFINAVLRRATREPEHDPAAAITDALARVAVETSHPAWLVERWGSAFGHAHAADFARANNMHAPASFRLNPLRAESDGVIEKLRAAGVTAERSFVAPGGWRVEGSGGASHLRALADEGLIYMQDEASQLVAHVLGARPGERVLDVCAAPGSKTTHVAALCGDRAHVVAGDVHEHRLRLVEELAARQGLKNVKTVALDAEGPLPFAEKSFDRVLVDAPCTGTGTLRHNPEIRWRIRPSDVAELSVRQLGILLNASRAVRVGGRLVYSTCSVEPEENEEVVAAFLKKGDDFIQVEASPAPAAMLAETGAARTWPHLEGSDGFFVAAFERTR